MARYSITTDGLIKDGVVTIATRAKGATQEEVELLVSNANEFYADEAILDDLEEVIANRRNQT